MFDIGFNEMFVVGVVVLVITGPKEIPKVLKTTAIIIKKIRSLKSDIHGKVDDFIDVNGNINADNEFKKEINQAVDLVPMKQLKADLHDQLHTHFNPIKEQLDSLSQLEDPTIQQQNGQKSKNHEQR